jgi:hypothetical protein
VHLQRQAAQPEELVESPEHWGRGERITRDGVTNDGLDVGELCRTAKKALKRSESLVRHRASIRSAVDASTA